MYLRPTHGMPARSICWHAAHSCLPACRAIGAEVLIDDNPGYAQECAEAGIHVLLYDWQQGYPWSKTPGGGPTHDRITRWVASCAALCCAVLHRACCAPLGGPTHGLHHVAGGRLRGF